MESSDEFLHQMTVYNMESSDEFLHQMTVYTV